jgi:glycosyltransferase involved in cell wall biosynthesis
VTTAVCDDRLESTPIPRGRGRRLLFVKDRLAWPRSSGHDVHTYYLMKALAESGNAVALATLDRPADAAIDGLTLAARFSFTERTPSVPPDGAIPISLTKWQEKFRSYWGIDRAKIGWVAAAAKAFDADAVVVVGLNVLPYLGGVTDCQRVWYAADEWVWHHLSQVKPFRPGTWKELKPALVKGLYERVYAPMLDRVWVVSDSDAKTYRRVTGYDHTDVMPNGVDADYFAPGEEPVVSNSCTFWGRLDFGPNVQALEWFVGKVWPRVRAKVPDARFDVFGFHPTSEVEKLAGRDGVTLTPDVPDLRPVVRSRAVAVLPFVSGGGIKNKLLEAAAMGMPVVATPRVTAGVMGTPPVVSASSPTGFADALVRLWADVAERDRLGKAAREWVVNNHTWAACANTALTGMGFTAKERA